MAAVLFFFAVLLLSSISPSIQHIRESVPLLRFKTSVNITNGDLHSWKTGTDPCNGKWFGIYCHGETVSGIHITGLGLSGTINVKDLTDLPNLRTIRLDNNLLSGPIPFFFLIRGLRSLMLSNNSLSGDIPDDFFHDMPQIRRLFLDHNRFEGQIPSSILQLPNLEEVHLQNNSFSGVIPELSAANKIIKTLDLSYNVLEGRIPDSIADRLDLNTTLEGNENLCGEMIMVECNATLVGDGQNVSASQWNPVTIVTTITSFTLLTIFFIVVAILNKINKKKLPEFLILDKGTTNENDDIQVKIPESTTNKKRGATIDGSMKKGLSQQGKDKDVNGGSGGTSDIIMVNSEKGSFGLPDLMKAAAEVLGNGSLGSAYKAVMSNGLSVVVKRIRDMNKLSHEAFDVEMRRFGKLHHPNILTPLAYHYRREEKLVVSEYMPNSSLLYVLHGDRGVHHSELTWATRLNIIKGVAHGMQFLHEEFTSYELPHGNLKSSNILLSETYEPLISDYAFLPLLNPNNASQTLFAFKTPEFAQTQQVSHKSDVYCFGIIILEILTAKFPSQYLNNGKGGTDIVQWVQSSFMEHKEEELIDPEIATDVDSVQQIVEMLKIGVACIESNPDERLDMREVVKRIEQVTT